MRYHKEPEIEVSLISSSINIKKKAFILKVRNFSRVPALYSLPSQSEVEQTRGCLAK